MSFPSQVDVSSVDLPDPVLAFGMQGDEEILMEGKWPGNLERGLNAWISWERHRFSTGVQDSRLLTSYSTYKYTMLELLHDVLMSVNDLKVLEYCEHVKGDIQSAINRAKGNVEVIRQKIEGSNDDGEKRKLNANQDFWDRVRNMGIWMRSHLNDKIRKYPILAAEFPNLDEEEREFTELTEL